METIKPIKKLDCLTALEVFRQVPINTTGHNWSKDGILHGRFYLQTNPKDERFDPRYTLTIKPFSPYTFKIKEGGEDMKLSADFYADFVRDPTMGGCMPMSLLVSGKRPRGLNLEFSNHIDDAKKAWSCLINDYISRLIDAGYNYVPNQNYTIAEISADRDTNEYSKDGKERLIEKEKILVVSPRKIEVRQGDVFGVPLVSDKVYRSICNLVR